MITSVRSRESPDSRARHAIVEVGSRRSKAREIQPAIGATLARCTAWMALSNCGITILMEMLPALRRYPLGQGIHLAMLAAVEEELDVVLVFHLERVLDQHPARFLSSSMRRRCFTGSSRRM